MKKKKLISLVIAGVVGLCVLVLWWLGVLQGLENKSLDFRFRLRGQIPPSPAIAIVVVDEDSIKRLGRWPWPRSVHGKLVDRLMKLGAKAIAFDILFLEADVEHGGADASLGASARQSGRVVFGSFFQKVTPEGIPAELALPIASVGDGSPHGFVNVYTELDGINRKIPLVISYDNRKVYSLALAGLSRFMDASPDDIIEKGKIPLNEYNEMAINFCGGYQTFPYYSFADVLDGKVAADNIRDKMILVGGTATALFDFKAIPFSPMFPGVEIHANTMSNVLRHDYLRPWPSFITLLLIAGFALFSGSFLGKLPPWKGGVTLLAVFSGYFLLTYFLFKLRHVYGEFVAPASGLAVSYIGVLFYNFMSEEKEKRWVKKTFSHYLSAHVMESILSDPNSLRLGGQRANLTVLFSDIRGFTTISEALKPEEVVELLNEYLSKMVEVVFRHDGTLDKFIGDAVMAFWGAPLVQADHARKAVLCAVEMIEELMKLQEKWRAEGRKIIEIGIGVNTGDMVVGNMGSKEKMEYTIIGDNVNLGSRLEGLNKEYKTRIIISSTTYEAVKDLVEAEPLGDVKVKGKEKTVKIFAVTGRKGFPDTLAKVVRPPKAENAAPHPVDNNETEKKPFNPDSRVEFKP
jgi:adenylate cyclase